MRLSIDRGNLYFSSVVRGGWLLVSGFWFLVSGFWLLLAGGWCVVGLRGGWLMVSGGSGEFCVSRCVLFKWVIFYGVAGGFPQGLGLIFHDAPLGS
jgi:hypothetical protein